MNEKQMVGEKAAEFVKDGMVVGLGTGSTVFYTIQKLGELVRQGLSIKGIPTSKATEVLAKKVGIPLTTFGEIEKIDLAIDGADEVDRHLNLIKGGGGALVREKIIAHAAETFIIVADSTKLTDDLGGFALPVEIVPFGCEITIRHIRRLGCQPQLRQTNGKAFVSDNGNYIVDCPFPAILRPDVLEQSLNMIPGVVENGLFVQMADAVVSVDQGKNVIIKERP